MLFDQEERPLARARFLVGDPGKDHVPREANPTSPQEHEGHRAHRDHVFHVDGAPAPDAAIGLDRPERIVGPPFAIDRHHVEVPVEQQRSRLTGAA